MKHWLAALLVATCVAGAGAARAQVFSPGPLSSVHKQLDGITACTKCHEEAGKHSNPKCIECHSEIGKRIDAGTGYHARQRNTFCAECHKEHKGGTAQTLIEWPGGKHGFNHGLTGWALQGSHKKPECKACHDLKRVEDAAVRKLVTEKSRPETFLGAPTACVKCHFDEHRGQEGTECTRCHTSDKFKEAPLFQHVAPFADFRLKGKHRNLACAKCHDDVNDEVTPADASPPPRARTYMQMQLKSVHGQNDCLACHEDVHHGEFGRNCVKCHSEDGWKTIKQSAEDTGFHDKTGYPLRGEHTEVSCKACHGPFPGLGQRAVFKGLKHGKCADCHIDAHEGQIAVEDGSVKCEKCHTVNGFVPVLFDAKMHESTPFKLQGSHQAVSCNLCHKVDKSLTKKVPAAIKREMSGKNRPLLVSDTKIAFADGVDRCETCHTDPHGGQFADRVKEKGCNACHQASSFADVTFNHDESRFPLTGKHKDVQCGACHLAPPDARGRMKNVVVYKPVEIACNACHADQHVGQLAKNGATTCETCHSTTGFKPAKFDHDKQSTFALEGKHKTARCAACHEVVDLGSVKSAKYKPLPSQCTGCHDDEHQGSFDAFIPASTVPPKEERCAACHSPKGWSPAKIAHDRTSFPLLGKHNGVQCSDCHGSDTTRPIPTSCAGCHQDPHAQEFGLMCRSCHTEDGFNAPNFTVDAHRRTNFPLSGRHAAIPCEECHIEKRERTFTRVTVDCASCHQKDATRATRVTVDHSRSPFANDCRQCHQPVSFTPAAFAAHEACFPIVRGVHAPVSCTDCHGLLRGAQANGTCANVAVRCAECHTHSADVEAKHHKGIQGYEHKSAKCAACHRAP